MSRFLTLALATMVAVPALAADASGTTGSIATLEANTSSAETYLQYHGRIQVLANGKLSEYRWGGTSCGSRVLTDTQLVMLQSALEAGTPITPRWTLGQGTAQCLVGFLVRS